MYNYVDSICGMTFDIAVHPWTDHNVFYYMGYFKEVRVNAGASYA